MTTKQSILEVVVDPTKAEQGSRRASRAYEDFLGKFERGTKRINEAFSKFITAAEQKNSSALKKMTAGWAKFRKFLVGGVFNAMRKGFSNAMSAITGGLGKLISLLGPAGLIGAINGVVSAGLKMEKFGITFSVISGNMNEANKELQNLLNVSNKLGANFEAAAAPAAKFFAASKDSLVGSEIRDIFKSFQEVSVALQLNKQEVTGVFLALQQIASKGRVSMEELRLQLAERVPGAMLLAARSMDMNMTDFESAVRKGTINSSEFLIKFGKTLHEEFGPAAAIAAQLGQSAINKFENALLQFFARISKSGVLESFQNFLDQIRMKFLDNAAVADVMGTAISRVIDRFSEFVGKIDDRAMLEAVVGVANAFVMIYNTILDILPSMETLSKTIRVVAGYIVNVGEFFSGSSRSTALEAAQKEANRLNKELNKAISLWNDNTKGMEEFGSSAMKAFLASDEAVAMQMKIESLMGQFNMAKIKVQELGQEIEEQLAAKPEKMKMFDAEELLGRAPASTTAISPEAATGISQMEMDRHLQTIRENVAEANGLQESSLRMTLEHVDKVEQARARMLEKQAEMVAFETALSSPITEENLQDMMTASEKLIVASGQFTEARAKFEELYAAAMAQEKERLEGVVESEVTQMTEFLTFGNEMQRSLLQERQTDIQAALDMQIISKAEANELILTMELEHQAKMGDIMAQAALDRQKFENQTNKARAQTLAGDIAKNTAKVSSSNKKLFEINKKARIAQAVMELPGAVMSSFSKGGGFPWGLIPAGITLASGLAYIQQIRSSSFGGGGGGGSVSGGSAPSSSPSDLGSATPTLPISDAAFTRSINGDPRTVDSSGTNINFEINAIDAQGVASVLQAQKGNIISMVQSAYTERGTTGGPVQ